MDKKLILVIEDDSPLREALRDKFSREGFDVLIAGDGEQGLALALQEHPDVLLLDLMLPREGGLMMLKKLREDPWGKTASVLVLTALAGNQIVEEAMRLGCLAFIVKADWKIAEVVAKVKEILHV